MEIFYHGTCHLFSQFDMSFLGTGEGKSKFGNGIYITSSYETAALYASKAAKANGKDSLYVYTVEVPDITQDNHVFSCKEVNPAVIQKVEASLGTLPQEANVSGKCFRKYIGNVLTGKKATLKQMLDKADAPVRHFHDTLISDVQVDCFKYTVFVIRTHTCYYSCIVYLLQKYVLDIQDCGKRNCKFVKYT